MPHSPEIWPPPPTQQPHELQQRIATLPISWRGWLPLILSVLGWICAYVSSSGPSTQGLSGAAFIKAFEADEALMGWSIVALLLWMLGGIVGLISWRSRSGKAAVLIALGGFGVFFLFLTPR